MRLVALAVIAASGPALADPVTVPPPPECEDDDAADCTEVDEEYWRNVPVHGWSYDGVLGVARARRSESSARIRSMARARSTSSRAAVSGEPME